MIFRAEYLSALVVLTFTGCSQHWFCDCRSLPPPPIPLMPPPPSASIWEAPKWWNGSTGETCLVHGTMRTPSDVPIVYGLFTPNDPELAEVRAERFPNTWRYVAGGCVIMNNSPTNELIRYCDVCRTQEAEWINAHKNHPNKGLERAGDPQAARQSPQP